MLRTSNDILARTYTRYQQSVNFEENFLIFASYTFVIITSYVHHQLLIFTDCKLLGIVKAWCTDMLHHQTAKHAASTEGNSEDAAS